MFGSLLVCMSMYNVSVWNWWKPEDLPQIPWNWSLQLCCFCELPWRYWECSSDPLEEQQALLSTDPSLQPSVLFCFFWDKLSICSWEAILELMAISLPQPPEHWYSSCELSQGYLSVPCSSFLWMYQDALYLLTKVFLFIIVCLSMCACTCVYEHLQRPARSLGAGVTGGMNCLT